MVGVLQSLAVIARAVGELAPLALSSSSRSSVSELPLDSGITVTVQCPLSFVPHSPVSLERKWAQVGTCTAWLSQRTRSKI